MEREKHTNLFPISFLISAENDVLWPVISFNSFIWVIIMDIVISSEPHPASGSEQTEERRGGARRVSRRLDIKIWGEQSHYSDIPLSVEALPLSADFNLSPWWVAAPHQAPSNNLAWTFTISFSSRHVLPVKKNPLIPVYLQFPPWMDS